jgi:RHS repeat-associated protein
LRLPRRDEPTRRQSGPGNRSWIYSDHLCARVGVEGSNPFYQYDGINRRKFAGFGYTGSAYESTSSYQFDPGDRITQLVDSIAGTIMRRYDLLDDLTDEQTTQGEVGYLFDNARRRQSMTVVGQPTVSYGWDNANRLTGITQGTTAIPIAYDNADRRHTLTLPNGILLTYTYDNDSRLTAMTWTLGSTAVGDLEYQYDADGRVTQKTGSFAQTQLPQPVSGNTFNAANEMTTFNGIPQTYDPNGNLANDGTNTYTWDARNYLTAIAGSSSATFAYDPLGRRDLKTINGVSTQFLYDGLNPVQEIQNGAPSANLITGLGIDEYLQRTDSAGARDYLTDILGSSLALTDSTGTIQTQYSYDPFDNSSSSGSASSNPYQFTGRENDGTGLNFNRARYYSPTLQRFIAQDPIDLKGGDVDLYGYVQNDPVTYSDKLGLWRWYGCWGGPNWSGCQTTPLEDLTPEEWAGLGAPVDQQDQCYYWHDFCYADCRVEHKDCAKARQVCGQKCDQELGTCLGTVTGLANNPGAWLAKLLFSHYHEDPGPEDVVVP